MRTLESGVEATALQTCAVARTVQASVVRAVYDCSQTLGRFVPLASPAPRDDTKRPKYVGVGDPVEIINTVYRCASDLLELHREFVFRLIEASEPALRAHASQDHRERPRRRAEAIPGLASVTHIARGMSALESPAIKHDYSPPSRR